VFEIRYDDATEAELRSLRRYESRRILDEIDKQLKVAPATPSRRRKKLQGLKPPWIKVRPVWQLRIGDFRVFYDVDQERGEVIARAIRRMGRKATEEIL
jgi:mRNA-degrading endonuclease RelE of RelBE toxin-antitoxin system